MVAEGWLQGSLCTCWESVAKRGRDVSEVLWNVDVMLAKCCRMWTRCSGSVAICSLDVNHVRKVVRWCW